MNETGIDTNEAIRASRDVPAALSMREQRERLDRVRADIEPDVEHALQWLRTGGPSDYDLSEALHYLERSASRVRHALEEVA